MNRSADHPAAGPMQLPLCGVWADELFEVQQLDERRRIMLAVLALTYPIFLLKSETQIQVVLPEECLQPRTIADCKLSTFPKLKSQSTDWTIGPVEAGKYAPTLICQAPRVVVHRRRAIFREMDRWKDQRVHSSPILPA